MHLPTYWEQLGLPSIRLTGLEPTIYAIAIAIAYTNIPLSTAHTWTLFHHPPSTIAESNAPITNLCNTSSLRILKNISLLKTT